MRNIQVSTEVFAAIWAARQPGENNESDVLHRVLKAESAPIRASTAPVSFGWSNNRYKMAVAEGFQIERNFKGKDYVAHATSGSWKLRNDGKAYPSLSALSKAINTGVENVWANWFYRESDGTRRPISDLRDPATITQRG